MVDCGDGTGAIVGGVSEVKEQARMALPNITPTNNIAMRDCELKNLISIRTIIRLTLRIR